MFEWLKEHAWKANPVALTKRCQNTSLRNQFSDLPPQDVLWCEAVNNSIRRRFCARPTQFLHNSRFHLLPLLTYPFRICRPTDVSLVQNLGSQPSRKTVAGLVRAALLAGIAPATRPTEASTMKAASNVAVSCG
jgi:hypothetical protein